MLTQNKNKNIDYTKLYFYVSLHDLKGNKNFFIPVNIVMAQIVRPSVWKIVFQYNVTIRVGGMSI